jgi:hypothetical protein
MRARPTARGRGIIPDVRARSAAWRRRIVKSPA